MYISARLFVASLVAALPAQASQYYDRDLRLNFQEHRTEADILFRVAIPANATAPFDVALQVVAPVATGWAGFAWGGGMRFNPLTMVWQNGEGVTASSRAVTSYSLPRMNPNAQLTVLAGSEANETHWKANILCQGCSSWMEGDQNIALNTQSQNSPFAWARSSAAPDDTSDPTSYFHYHDRRGYFDLDLRNAQNENFDQAVLNARRDRLRNI
ncbi:hypothetical protein S40288_02042 [Stachybotrys chartarum IBT 40288]|nr:hypothetical protein S40288_02042 [Stachybotrys chartarum IBT 40288]